MAIILSTMLRTVLVRRAVPGDYPGMLLLQARNFIGNLSPEDARHGFLSIEYAEEQFDEINRDLGIAVAVRGDQVVAYLCATTFGYASRFPVLRELIDRLRGRMIGSVPVNEETTFVYGPVCISRSLRGSGILNGLFEEIRRMALPRYRQCILFIADRNPRSLRAHLRKLGMQQLGTFVFNGNTFHMLGADITSPPCGAPGREQRLGEIAAEIRACPACRTGCTGTAVPGEGTGEEPVVFVGEAPGREEAKSGRPFVGRSGKFLRAMIREAGMDDTRVFITSPVHYLPDRGTPSPAMIEHGALHLRKQIGAIRPCLVVLLGNAACRALLSRKIEIAKQHGTVVEQDGMRFLITFHPAYAMRFPEGKRLFLQDFALLKSLITSEDCARDG